MAPCGTAVIWTSVPVGSIFKLQCIGDGNTFDVSALVSMNDDPQPSLEHDDIVPGPASIEITGKKQRWDIAATLIVVSTLTKGILMKAWLEDAGGTIVQVPDGNGGMKPAQCEWTSGKTAGSTLEVTITIRSVKV
jgi:hypothetical protein